jgi:flagellar hook-associated protein 2
MGISLNPASLLSGNGLDVTTVVNQILNQRSGQLSEWSSEQSLLRTQAGLLTSINSDLGSLATALTALSDPIGPLTAQSATSSDSSLVTATADSLATAGNHTIVVNNLASAGVIYTSSLPGGATTSILPPNATTGDLRLQIGGSNGITADIPVTQSQNDTLTSLATFINQQSAAQKWGVSSAVVTDAIGSRLSISSQATGTPGAIAISNNTTNLSFNLPQGGVNASLTIDGIPYSSTSNSVAGAISGVTLNLANAQPNTAVQITVGADTSQITDAINTFVNAYNRVISDINEQYLVDTSTNTEGPLGSDSSLRTLQSMLLNDVTHSVTGNNGLVNLASLGINMNNDGTLTIGSTPSGETMSQVLSKDVTAFRQFFQNDSATGFANLFHRELMNLTDSTQGLLNLDLAQNKAQQDNLADSISKFQDQLAAQQKQLTSQFSLVNASLQSYPLLLQQITATLATLDSSSASKNS